MRIARNSRCQDIGEVVNMYTSLYFRDFGVKYNLLVSSVKLGAPSSISVLIAGPTFTGVDQSVRWGPIRSAYHISLRPAPIARREVKKRYRSSDVKVGCSSNVALFNLHPAFPG